MQLPEHTFIKPLKKHTTGPAITERQAILTKKSPYGLIGVAYASGSTSEPAVGIDSSLLESMG